jgi:hypothetical protein
MTERQYLIAVYCEGCAYFLTAGPSLAKSAFGGPRQVTISGVPETIWKPDELHYIGRVSAHDLAPLARYSSDLPLVYGVTFDGCRVRYEIESPSKVSLLDLDPARAAKDFPYSNYPSILPFVPLRLGRKQRMDYKTFSNEFPNMDEHQPADVVVAVPEAVSLGNPIWGPFGGDVTIIFEYQAAQGTVTACNVCD